MLDCFPARVVDVRRITPNMIRVQLETMQGRRWYADGRGDERIDIALPREGRTVADFQAFTESGAEGPAPEIEATWRHYTVRRVHDGGSRLDIDFAVHEGGFASGWAERAEPGHVVGLFDGGHHPSQYHQPPADAEHQLLVADATGLPGLARILEELAPGARATAIVEVPTAEDRQDLATEGDVTIEWLVGSGNGLGPSALPEAIAAQHVPDSPWYAWVACEAAASRRIRTHLRREMGLARDRHHAIGYWNESLTGNRSAEVD